MAEISKGTTIVTSLFLFLITLIVLQFLSNFLASSPPLTILGGFLSSFSYLFALIAIGNLTDNASWSAVIASMLIAIIVASSIHRVSATTCILFSSALTYKLNQYTKKIYTKN
eukprot:TRINITY_DN17925_c0_g1_i1.p1 TRINITY_DN17925_c0_g1~~TRINITY_DN17925_c0_g1_i1.p1  ORF type:complete len:113 (-),score=12.32 TRINITY_DN17925_c0_g1_i1:50-388(-)